MRIKSNFAVILAALVLGAMGCGGDGDLGGGGDAAAFAGVYRAAYARANGTILVSVQATGQIEVVVNDDTEGTFSGNGPIREHNGFDIVCTGPGGRTVTVVGTLSGTGTGRTAHGTTSGVFTITYTAQFAAEPNHSIFAAHYEGFYLGTNQGTWSADVNSSGQFVGVVHSDTAGNFNISGQVSPTGLAILSGEGPAALGLVTFQGRFVLVADGIRCMGTWTSSASGAGTWEGGNSNEG